jgi:single-strand DNA-binding protein
MANYNKSILIGNLCKNPELRYTPQGTAVVNITLAINRKYKSGEEMKEDVAFVSVVAWGKTAEIINQYCSKGSPLMVEGRIQTRSWEKDGQKQYKTEVVAENIQLLGTKKEEQPDKAIDQTSEQTWLSEQEG